jgi:enoyl-CoA hydratase/carnithine racemase
MQSYKNYRRLNHTANGYLKTMPKPVIGRINGPAAGGGCLLALDACDIIIASTAARFGLREVNTGVSGPVHLMYSCGRSRGMYLALTGAWISAEKAEEWGLILKAVPPEQLDAEVDKVATMLEDLSPLTLAATKDMMNTALSAQGSEVVRILNVWQNNYLHATEDRKEAQASFLEKRKPKFVGY